MNEDLNVFEGEDNLVFSFKRNHRIKTPNGDEFRIIWDKVRQSIEIRKEYSDNEGNITINPGVSNVIYIK